MADKNNLVKIEKLQPPPAYQTTNENQKDLKEQKEEGKLLAENQLIEDLKLPDNNAYQKSQQSKFQKITIIDVENEYSKGFNVSCSNYLIGNYQPMIVCLDNGYISPSYLDQNGYNILHSTVTWNQLNLVKLLIEKYKIDPNIKSKNKQTAFMIACNFGYLEIIKYLAKYLKDDLINEQDNYGFTALTYSVKQNNFSVFFYLLYLGASVKCKDNNGCTLVHWAAFKNNVFFLRLFNQLNLPMDQLDQTGLTPFQRALSNDCYDAIHYFCEEIGQDIIPEKLDVKTIASPAISSYLRVQISIKRKRPPLIFMIENWMKDFSVLSHVLAYLTLIIIFLYFISDFSNWNKLFLIVALYSMIYTMWFIMYCNQKNINQDRKAQQKQKFQFLKGFEGIDEQIMKKLDFTKLNYTLFNNSKQTEFYDLNETNKTLVISQKQEQQYFPHYLVNLIENNQFQEAESFDKYRYCPICFTYIAPKCFHSNQSKRCVPFFNHYSTFFSRDINYENHFFYLGLLGIQQIVMLLFIFCEFEIYSPQKTSRLIFYFFEVSYLIAKQNGIINLLVFLLVGILLLYNSIQLLIEIVGILINQTRYEIFNRQLHSYLYTPVKFENNKMWKIYTNKLSQSLLKNIIEYLKRSSLK